MMRARLHYMLRLADDSAGLHAQLVHCLDNERKAMGQVIARAAIEFHPLLDFASDNPKPVVLDLVQPPLAGRWFSS